MVIDEGRKQINIPQTKTKYTPSNDVLDSFMFETIV